MSLRIGVDFGGVLSVHDGANTDGSEHRATLINMPDAIESLRLLKDLGHKLYLNSFCGKARAIETKKSLDENVPDLFDGIYFVKSKKFKGDVTKYLGCDVMIDDTLDILMNIHQYNTCPNKIWFKGDPSRNQTETSQPEELDANIISADNWKEVVAICSNIKPSAQPDVSVNISSKIYSI